MAGELVGRRLEKAERRRVRVAPGVDGELKVVVRVVRRRVRREGARRTVLEPLVDRQNDELASARERPVIHQAREVRLHPDVLARVPGQDLLHAVGRSRHDGDVSVAICRLASSRGGAARRVEPVEASDAGTPFPARTSHAPRAAWAKMNPMADFAHSDLPPPSSARPSRPTSSSGFRGSAGATGDFSSLLNTIGLSVRIIHSRVRAAGLAGLLGYTGDTNVQGEQVQKLDAFANDVLCTVLERNAHC